MKFKKVLALGLVGAMAISMAACGKTSSSTDNGGSGNAGTSNETVSLRVWGGEEDQNLLKELVEKFKKTYRIRSSISRLVLNQNQQLRIQSLQTLRQQLMYLHSQAIRL